MSTFDEEFFEEIDDESFGAEEYEALRSVLSEDYLDADYAELDETLTDILSELRPEEAEIFKMALRPGRDIGRISAQLGRQVATQVNRGRGRRRPSVRRRPVHARRYGTGGCSAVGQLLRLASSPAFTRVLGSLLSGDRGRGSIRVGNTSVPVGGLLNLLGSLAIRATQEAAELHHGEGIPDYLVDDDGEAIGDIANPDERADLLWERMEQEGAFEVSDYDASEASEDPDLDGLFEDDIDNESIIVEWH